MTISLSPTLSPSSYTASIVAEGTISTDANGDVEFSALLDGGSVAVVGISGKPVTNPTAVVGVGVEALVFNNNGTAEPVQGNPTPSTIMESGDALFSAFEEAIGSMGKSNANFREGMQALENSFNMLESQNASLTA